MYANGQGVTQDYKEAVKWFRLAAKEADTDAQFQLGAMYQNGLGVLQDYVLAHMWFNLSGLNGDKDAVDAILEIRLRQLAKLEEIKITEEQGNLDSERKDLEKLLSSKTRLKTLIKNELKADAEIYGDDRNSPIVFREEATAFDETELISSDPVTVVLSERGWIRAAKGHDIDPISLNYKSGDNFKQMSQGKTNQLAVFIDSSGRCYSLPSHSLPSARSFGEPVSARLTPPDGVSFEGVMTGTPDTVYLLAADNINFNGVLGLHVTSTRILTSTGGGYIDEFDEDLFTAAARNTTWLQQMGGPRLRRWDGVKQAINAIVNDSTLTTGAYFGFGHWNAGETGRHKNSARGGRYCHRHSDCTYYQGWGGFNTSHSLVETGSETTTVTNDDGTTTTTTTPIYEQVQTDVGTQSRVHPNGTSSQCNRDSCINVAVSPRGAGLIMNTLNPLGMAWGTDSHAFSQMAEDYFKDSNAGGSILDPDSICQLNYVIVIGDGAMTNTGVLTAGGQTAARMERLRKMGVKSLYVAYGGGISGTNLDRFHELARIGSSNLGEDTTAQECRDHDECERAIIANTPEDLKSDLSSKILSLIHI